MAPAGRQALLHGEGSTRVHALLSSCSVLMSLKKKKIYIYIHICPLHLILLSSHCTGSAKLAASLAFLKKFCVCAAHASSPECARGVMGKK